jgi:hypothetical protein
MKKQFRLPVQGTFIVLYMLLSINSFAQDFAMLDYPKSEIKIPFRTDAEFTINGIWSVFDDFNNLEKIEIYDRNTLVEVKSEEQAQVFYKNLQIEKLEQLALINRTKMQTLYDDYDYVSDKKIILDNYKIVEMDLLFQAKEVDSYKKVEPIAQVLSLLNEKVASLVYKKTQELESQLKKCLDIEKIKSILLK